MSVILFFIPHLWPCHTDTWPGMSEGSCPPRPEENQSGVEQRQNPEPGSPMIQGVSFLFG